MDWVISVAIYSIFYVLTSKSYLYGLISSDTITTLDIVIQSYLIIYGIDFNLCIKKQRHSVYWKYI